MGVVLDRFKTEMFGMRAVLGAVLAVSTFLAAGSATAQGDGGAPEDITILFATGSASVSREERAELDAAARLFRDGNPVVMILTGSADTVGDAATNLDLSIARARSVADGLVARGIPANRLQVLGQGNSELPLTTADEVPSAENRSVRITWR